MQALWEEATGTAYLRMNKLLHRNHLSRRQDIQQVQQHLVGPMARRKTQATVDAARRVVGGDRRWWIKYLVGTGWGERNTLQLTSRRASGGKDAL